MRIWEIEQKIREEIDAACDPIKAAIRAKWEPVLKEARERESGAAARQAEKQIQGALAEALWPVGTKLVEWTEFETYGWGTPRKIPWKPTGREGFYDIFDQRKMEKVRPRVSHAEPFIRLAKKNGTPSKLSSDRFRTQFGNWFPEKTHPDTYEHPAKKKGAQ